MKAISILLLLTAPIAVRGQWTWETNNGTITITRYTGPGGQVVVPAEITGLPVTSIGDGAFVYCTSLTSITIPDSVTSIGLWVFAYCTSLTSITIPDRVTSIGREAFIACTSLTNVVLGNGLTTIAGWAFSDCSSLTSITIPDSVTTIGDEAFAGCTSLTSITTPDSVTTIGDEAFYGCRSLTNVVLGNGLTSVGLWTFSYCTNLSAVYFLGNAPNSGGDTLGGTSATVYYLPGTIGWRQTFDTRPTALWVLPYPVILATPPYFGIHTNEFSFVISWSTNLPVVVEVSTKLSNTVWFALSTNTLTDGAFYFRDPNWSNYLRRFYRVRSP